MGAKRASISENALELFYMHMFSFIITQPFKPNLTKRFLKHVRDSFQLVKNPLVMFTTLLTLLLVKIFLEKMDRLKVFGKDGKATRRPNINCPENYRQMHVVFLWVYWIKLIFFLHLLMFLHCRFWAPACTYHVALQYNLNQ